MRDHAKAPPIRSTLGRGKRRGRPGFAAFCALCFAAFLGGPVPAATAADQCPNEAIREQQHAAFLPDCRAYELVSPAQKFGYAVGGGNEDPGLQVGVAADGSTVSYASFFPLDASAAAGSWGGFGATRGAAGWATVGIPVAHGPNSTGSGVGAGDVKLLGTTPDQSASVYWDCTSEPYGAIWIRRADGSHREIAPANAAATFGRCRSSGEREGQPWFLGISDDGRHVLFNTNNRLGPASALPGSGRILYEWVDDGGAGALRVVNRTDDPTLTLLDAGDASLGGGTPTAGADGSFESQTNMRNAISDGADGHSRIFFQNPAPESNLQGGGPLYMRLDGVSTVQISAPAPGYTPASPPTATGVKYIDAARDGSKVFFFADGDLAPGAPPGGGLYRYDVDPDGAGPLVANLVWVGGALSGAATTGMADADGSRLYYQHGSDIYLAEGDSARQVVANFQVGTSLSSRGPEPGQEGLSGIQPGFRATSCPSANVSADGRYLAFTGLRTDTEQESRVLRYDADADELAEVSTSTYAPPSRKAVFSAYCGVGSGAGRLLEKRVMSEDGQFVFFDSLDSLLPRDVNGASFDVYRWRAEDGSLALLSGGVSPRGSSFQGADASGENAFLLTLELLSPQDGDRVYDLYDARMNGGFLASPGIRSCEGDACQAPGSGPPALAVASAAFQGPADRVARKRKAHKKKRKAGRRHTAAKAKKASHTRSGKGRRGHSEVAK